MTETNPAADAAIEPAVTPQAQVDAQAAADEAENRPEGTGAGPKPAEAKESALPDPVKMVENADAALAELDPKIQEARQKMADAEKEFKALVAERDTHLVIKDKYGEKLSHADAVRRIQAQTVKTLQETKDKMVLASTALRGAGLSVFPSKLDEAMSLRKKPTDHVANHAKFIQQRQADNLAARTGG